MKNKDLSALIKQKLNPKDSCMIHGTSVEAIIALFERGKIGKEVFSPKMCYENYMFFVPNPEHFKGHELDGYFEELEWEETIRNVELYAEYLAFLHYTTSIIGPIPEEISMVDVFDYFEDETELLLLDLDMTKRGFGDKMILETLETGRQRKGVLIGLNDKIFEKKIEEGKDMPEEEVCIYLPDGLDIKYINSIMPIGKIDKDLINEYFCT